MKRGTLQTLVLTTLLLLSITFVVAQENETKTCDQECNEFWMSATPACIGEQKTSGVFPDCECGWECKSEKGEDNRNTPEITACRDKCKANFEDEKNRGRCIRKCKSRFKFRNDFKDEEIEIVDGGTTPDSFWYFLDTMFDGFSSDIEVKEEKVAEIKAMIEKGDLESARKALEHYKDYAEKLGKEVNPEDEEAAKRSSLAIEKALIAIEDKLSADDKKEFYDDILDNEEKITTAAEIAGKIKDLCQSLSEIDPSEYYRICKTGDDAPEWQKKLHRDLTDEQKQEAKKFGNIMSQCFKTSGQDCKCEEIPFPAFADACSEAAPLATACDVDGNEAACEKLDNLQMPELPDHLQDVFDDLEDMNEDKYDMHMPRECVEAGVTNPKECGKVMIETNAPPECKQALLDSGCERERECREICDKIMMEKHAPECVEEGITDQEECKDFMYSIDRRPTECAQQGIHDIRDCKKFLKEGGPRKGPMIDFNCKEIQDPMERLDCFDKASSQAKGFGGMDDDYEGNCMTDSDWKAKKQECQSMYGPSAGDEPIYGDSGDGYECVVDTKCIDFSQGKMDFEEIKEKERECANRCENQNKAWDFSYGECVCKSNDYEDNNQAKCDDCASQCPDASRTSCGPNGCECHYDGDEYNEPEQSPDTDSGTDNGEGDTDTAPEDTAPEESPPEDTQPEDTAPEGDSTITGNVFLDYYYN